MAFNPVQSFMQGQQAGRNIKVNRLQNALSGQMGQAGFNPSQSSEFKSYSAMDPVGASRMLDTYNKLDEPRKKALYQDARTGAKFLENGQYDDFLALATNRVEQVESLGGDSSGTRMVLDMFNSGNIEGAISHLKRTELAGIEEGLISDPIGREIKQAQLNNLTGKGQTGGKSQKQAYFNDLVKIAESDPAGETTAGKAALIELGMVSRASTTAAERIASNENLANGVANAERLKAQAKEEGKSTAQLKFKPLIQSAITVATKEAESKGEALSKLGRLNASLPGLQEVTGQLRELSEISTSTMGGRFFDKMVQETGFGSTKGGTARSKLVSIVNNQVLPLLKETFGGAMTETEGARLVATMGDPDATHDSRMGALDAFIAQKSREIQGLERELVPTQQTGQQQTQQVSDEDLLKKYGGL